MFEKIPPEKRVTVMVGMALCVSLFCLTIALCAVHYASKLQHRVAQIADESRNLREKVDRQNGQIMRLRKSMDDSVLQLKNRDDLIVKAGEVQQEISKQQSVQMAEQRTRQTLLADVRQKLEKPLEDGKGLVFLADNDLVIRLPEKMLFGAGKVELSTDGADVLKDIATVLNSSVKDYAVVVEGHTDNQPVAKALQAKYANNWEFSSARASNVVVWLASQGKVDGDRLSAAGRGENGSVSSNDTPEGRSANRRIDILVRLDKEVVKPDQAKPDTAGTEDAGAASDKQN